MTTDHSTEVSEPQSPHFGTRLQSAREALCLERKEAALQLRLNEKVILMMEKDSYPADLPVTFIRGYLRAYGKLLQIPEAEIKTAIEHIKPKPQSATPAFLTPLALDETVSSSHHFMQFFTYLIVATLIALVAMWWWNRSSSPSENKLNLIEPQALTEVIATPPLLAAPAPIQPENPLDSAEQIKDHKKPTTVAVAKPKKLIVKKLAPVESLSDDDDTERTHSDEG